MSRLSDGAATVIYGVIMYALLRANSNGSASQHCHDCPLSGNMHPEEIVYT